MFQLGVFGAVWNVPAFPASREVGRGTRDPRAAAPARPTRPSPPPPVPLSRPAERPAFQTARVVVVWSPARSARPRTRRLERSAFHPEGVCRQLEPPAFHGRGRGRGRGRATPTLQQRPERAIRPPKTTDSRDSMPASTGLFARGSCVRAAQTWRERDRRTGGVPSIPVATQHGWSRHPKGRRATMTAHWECLDGNEAAARVAYAVSEVIAIYPITPASPMGEHCDDWSAAGRPNLWGAVPDVIEMQSEAGAAGRAARRAAEGRARDDVHRVAGPAADDPEHVQDRRRADAGGHPRRGPHDRDPRAVDLRRPQRRHGTPARPAGRCSPPARSRRRTTSRSSPTPRRCASRVPFLHFFDGFRTSHEINKIAAPRRRRPAGARSARTTCSRSARRGLTPDAPVVRGTAQNPDVFFQAREACNPFYLAVPGIVQEVMDELAARTGRRYGLVDYHGAPDAERVDRRHGLRRGRRRGDGRHAASPPARRSACSRSGCSSPFPADAARRRAAADRPRDRRPRPDQGAGRRRRAALPGGRRRAGRGDGRRRAAVRDGARGSSAAATACRPRSSRPSMVKPIFDELAGAAPEAPLHGRHRRRRHAPEPADRPRRSGTPRPAGEVQARLLRPRLATARSAPTRPRSRSSARAPTCTPRATSSTTRRSRARSPSRTCGSAREPIRSTYLIDDADFVACHQFGLLEQDEGARGRRATARRSCSTPRTARTRSGSTCRPRSSGRSSTRSSTSGSSTPLAVAGEAGHGQPDQHGHAAVLLRSSPASCRATRRSRGSRRSSRRPTRKRGEAVVAAQLRRDRPLARAARARCRSAPIGDALPMARRRSRTTSPTSSRGSPRG